MPFQKTFSFSMVIGCHFPSARRRRNLNLKKDVDRVVQDVILSKGMPSASVAIVKEGHIIS